jgi:hypothetical protein
MQTLKPENWFYCGLCQCRSYKYGCECGGTTCNAAGCPKCEGLYELAREAEKNNTAPSEESLIAKWRAAGYSEEPGNQSDEERTLKKIFGE